MYVVSVVSCLNVVLLFLHVSAVYLISVLSFLSVFVAFIVRLIDPSVLRLNRLLSFICDVCRRLYVAFVCSLVCLMCCLYTSRFVCLLNVTFKIPSLNTI